MTLLRDGIQKRDFAKPIAARVSKTFGPVSRHLTAKILPQMCHASRASHPGLAVGFVRVLCNGMCTAQRFHMQGEERRCRVGCQDESDSLSHYNECPLLYNFFTTVWRHTAIQPRRSHLLNYLVAQTFLRCLQFGIVVMEIIDAFVHAHTHHRRNVDNLGNFGNCMEGRTRFMTAITPTYAHAYQAICLAGRHLVVPHQKFRVPAANARYPHLPNSRPLRAKKATLFMAGLFTPMGELVLPMVKPWLAGVLSLVHLMEIFMSCLGQSSQPKHTLPVQGPKFNSNNTVGPLGPAVRGSHSCIFYDSKPAAGVCLGTVQTRANVQLGLECQRL